MLLSEFKKTREELAEKLSLDGVIYFSDGDYLYKVEIGAECDFNTDIYDISVLNEIETFDDLGIEVEPFDGGMMDNCSEIDAIDSIIQNDKLEKFFDF